MPRSLLFGLPLLIAAGLASSISAQHVVPAPPAPAIQEGPPAPDYEEAPPAPVPRIGSVDASFPLPENASARLTRPFRSPAPPNWKAVRLMAELSFLAYEDSFPTVQNRLRLYDLALGEFVTVDHHHFITAWDETNEVLVVAFRGTDLAQLADVWTDLDYDPVPTDNGKVHRGFYDASTALFGSVTAAIDRREPRHVWLTGHSLGGAIATLTMRRLQQSGMRVDGLVTFGQPRVGDRDFTEQMNSQLGIRMLRVINEDDVVASLPPRIPLLMPAYYSGGSVVQFLDGELVRSRGVQIMAQPEEDDIFGAPVTNPPREAVRPHGPSGKIPPDPDQLTPEEFEQLKQILDEAEELPDDAKRYGGPLDWVSNLKRRAAQHAMHLYIQNIERYAAEGK
ncbi:MAG: lipase family protein [Candidatus Paceibacterota bacterium]